VFGDVSASIVEDISGSSEFFTTRAPYVLILGLLLLAFVLKKKIHELAIASWLLFFSIGLFILVFILQIIFRGTFENHDSKFG